MRRAVLAALALLLLVPSGAGARHHPRRHGHVIIGGGHVWNPFWYPPYYPYPYLVPYPVYAPPPPPDDTGRDTSEREEEADTDADRASYGLVQLREVPDGAAVDLDGRFWLRAERLGERWLALPRGPHTIVVHVRGERPVERRVEIEAGENHVVQFAPARRPPR